MNKKQKKVALYLRVSTFDQTTENQRRDLMAVAERADWAIVDVYEDLGISGAKGRDKRPAFDRLLKDATRRRFELIAVWSVDRLGRNLQDLLHFLTEIHSYNIDVYLYQQGLDTSTPTGRAMFQMMGIFAEFERTMIQERVRAGIARAKANGVILGRRKTDLATENAIRATLATGTGILKTAKLHGVGTSVVQRIKAEIV
jgi:DNA invertase Pin-like site-specific DNA recombinase